MYTFYASITRFFCSAISSNYPTQSSNSIIQLNYPTQLSNSFTQLNYPTQLSNSTLLYYYYYKWFDAGIAALKSTYSHDSKNSKP